MAHFNDYVTSVFTSPLRTIGHPSWELLLDSMLDIATSQEGIIAILNSLKPKKATDSDRILNRILGQCFGIVSSSFYIGFDKSLNLWYVARGMEYC